MHCSFAPHRPIFVDAITQKKVQILGMGSNPGVTVRIVHTDGSTQEQFLRLLKPLSATQRSQE